MQMTAREEAQSRQMAFELGYTMSPEAPLPTNPARLISDKQIAFLKRLVGERDLTPELASVVQSARDLTVRREFTSKAASKLINALLAAPMKTATADEPQAGIYDLDGKMLVRVYLGQQSGKMLVKEIKISEVETTALWSVVSKETVVEYEYLGAAAKVFRGVQNARRLSVEEVGQLGLTTNTCMVCGRRLDDPESVDAGIGPVCASKY